MKIGFFQFNPLLNQTEKNLTTIETELAGVQCDLVVLPELATSGYYFRDKEDVLKAAQPIPGPTIQRLVTLARARNTHLVIGLPELAEGKVYNSAVFIGPEGVLGTYRKVHLFNREKEFFEAGNQGFPLFSINGVKIAILICFDHMFPEAARTVALKGADIICHPSNLVLPEYGQLTTRVRAIENRVFWILANRSGQDHYKAKTISYTGCSQIVGSDGKVLAQAGEKETRCTIVEIDPLEARNKQLTKRNHLFEDRRPEFYFSNP